MIPLTLATLAARLVAEHATRRETLAIGAAAWIATFILSGA